MIPANAHQAFRDFARDRGVRVDSLSALEGAQLMTDFFEQQSASGVQPDAGDMLLFQWGTYDWGDGLHFEIDVTRQFIDVSLEDDDAISQLHITFLFAPDSELGALGNGNFWCETIDGVAEFRSKVSHHPALVAVGARRAASVRVTFEFV